LLPEQDTFALLATAFVVFMLTCAIMAGILLRFVPQIVPLAALALSAGMALLVTAVTALFVRRTIRRGASRIDPQAHQFGVWGEDSRQRPKNLRRR
jgi:hypothetical protein